MADSDFWRTLAVSFRDLDGSYPGSLWAEWIRLDAVTGPGATVSKCVWGLRGPLEARNRFEKLADNAAEKLLHDQPDRLGYWLTVVVNLQLPRPGEAGSGGIRNVAEASAAHCERIANEKGDRPSFASFAIPDFRYFPTHLFEKQGPKQWARFRFLQACERLKIPSPLWPRFNDLALPRNYGFSYLVKETLSIPSFEPLYESESEWRNRVQQMLDKILEKNAVEFRIWFKREVDSGQVRKIKATRGTSPINLRYEWAVRKYCLKHDYKAMSSDEYTADRIRKNVNAILSEIGLVERK